MMNSTARNLNDLQRHAVHIKNQEYDAARTLLELGGNGTQRLSIRDLGDFAVQAYSRVVDMFGWHDFATCQRFVMVGCGPLPVTLLHVADKYPDIKIFGVDIDPDSIAVAREVVSAFGVPQMTLVHDDGTSYDYSRDDIIYVANLVYPKLAVLNRIARTGRAGTLVVLRDPTRTGEHLADVGMNAVDDNYRIEGVGIDSRVFKSRHIFLRLAGEITI